MVQASLGQPAQEPDEPEWDGVTGGTCVVGGYPASESSSCEMELTLESRLSEWEVPRAREYVTVHTTFDSINDTSIESPFVRKC